MQEIFREIASIVLHPAEGRGGGGAAAGREQKSSQRIPSLRWSPGFSRSGGARLAEAGTRAPVSGLGMRGESPRRGMVWTSGADDDVLAVPKDQRPEGRAGMPVDGHRDRVAGACS